MMSLPEPLQAAINQEMEKFSLHTIVKAREELTNRYRQRRPDKEGFVTTEEERCAYIAARLPATYAAIYRVLAELEQRAAPSIESLLDLGAGPGTVMWAACEIFPNIKQITLIEKDGELAALGKKMAMQSSHSAMTSAEWIIADMEQVAGLPSSDLVMLSYSAGELAPAALPSLIERCWKAAGKFLIVIEPGTPVGFERIRAIRDLLIALKGHMVAPCPHLLECPMSGGDWCHFSERFERSSIHRHLKEGTLGYEDEKFSYMIFSKETYSLPEARVLRYPLKRSGHVVLTLCTKDGVQQETISKRTPERYKKARKLEWGDYF